MFIYEIVLNTEFESVFRILKRNYGIENGYEYENLYSRLKDMNPTSIGLLTIYINAYRQSDEDSIFIEDFDENDTSLYFDVSAYKTEEDDCVYSIASLSYSDFLGCKIDKDTLQKMSPSAIIAHSLYEITAYSFDDNV